MNNIQLSVVIITYNEEKNIQRCLDSVKPIADQILVLDSLSDDNTKSICLSNNIDFEEQAFLGHIQQKNKALELAKYNVVLSLDADEALDEEAVGAIQHIKKNWTEGIGYEFNRLTQYCGKWVKHCGWYPDRKLRLVDRRFANWGGQNPHDKLNLNNGVVKRLNGKILHYTLHTQQEHIKQINFFTDISSQALYNKGKRTTIIKILFAPIFKFFRDYVLKLGFLDGFTGFVISANSAHAKFLKYVKLYYLQKQK